MRFALLLSVGVLFCAAHCPAADWPQFRGADRTGISSETRAPLTWSAEKNVKWKVALPVGGNSSPIVSGDRVFLSCAENARGTGRGLYCFSRADGKRLWVKTVAYEKSDPTHAANPYCASTPAADGKHVVVWHGSAGLYCYDYDGNELWKCDLGVIRHIWGFAGSPVIHGGTIILNCGPGERSFVAAIDLNTGKPLWQTDEPGGAEDKSPKTGNWLGSWSTPVITRIDGKDQAIITMPGHVNAYDPKSGEIVWTCEGTGDLAYTDVMINSELGVGIAMAGYGGRAMGFKLGGAGNITATHRLWQSAEKPPQRIGTGVMIGKYLYLAAEPGFSCIEPLTGKELWKHRPLGEVFWASITAVGDRLYVTSQKGSTFVFAADPSAFKLLATNEVGEKSNSTIAVSEGQIFLRTYEHLYCIEEK